MTLKVNIPVLSGSMPPGWTVSIIDNPGFGEAKEHITQLAEASMVTSSAYIYLIQTENVGGREAADFFKQLQSMDKSRYLMKNNTSIWLALIFNFMFCISISHYQPYIGGETYGDHIYVCIQNSL